MLKHCALSLTRVAHAWSEELFHNVFFVPNTIYPKMTKLFIKWNHQKAEQFIVSVLQISQRNSLVLAIQNQPLNVTFRKINFLKTETHIDIKVTQFSLIIYFFLKYLNQKIYLILGTRWSWIYPCSFSCIFHLVFLCVSQHVYVHFMCVLYIFGFSWWGWFSCSDIMREWVFLVFWIWCWGNMAEFTPLFEAAAKEYILHCGNNLFSVSIFEIVFRGIMGVREVTPSGVPHCNRKPQLQPSCLTCG